MKKLFFILLLLPSLLIHSQNIKQKADFKYYGVENLDSKGNSVGSLNFEGVIVFSEAQGLNFISITIGDEILYNGQVSQSKVDSSDPNTMCKVYLVVMDFQGEKVPLQIFETYNKKESEYIPQYFIVNIHSAQTGELVQGQLFKNISRIK